MNRKYDWELLFYNDTGKIPTTGGETITLSDNIDSYHFIMIEMVTTANSFYQAVYCGIDLNVGSSSWHYNLTPVWNQFGLWLDVYVYPNDNKIVIMRGDGVYYKYIRCIKGLRLK